MPRREHHEKATEKIMKKARTFVTLDLQTDCVTVANNVKKLLKAVEEERNVNYNTEQRIAVYMYTRCVRVSELS